MDLGYGGGPPPLVAGVHGWRVGYISYHAERPPKKPRRAGGGTMVGCGGLRWWADATVGREEPTVGGVAPAHPTWATPKQ